MALGAILGLAACEPSTVPGKCETGAPFPYTAEYDMESCPADIKDWMDRANGCAHFAGEEAYDPGRGKYIQDEMNDLECNTLGCDYDALFTKYEGDVVYAAVLSEYAGITYGSEDELPLCEKSREVP